jgi:hypothetical protein
VISIFTWRFVFRCFALYVFVFGPLAKLLRDCRWIFTLDNQAKGAV